VTAYVASRLRGSQLLLAVQSPIKELFACCHFVEKRRNVDQQDRPFQETRSLVVALVVLAGPYRHHLAHICTIRYLDMNAIIISSYVYMHGYLPVLLIFFSNATCDTCLSSDSLGMPEHALRVDLLLQRRKSRVYRVTIVQLVCRRGIVRWVNIIEVRSELGLWLRLDNGIIQAVDEVDRVACQSIVLENPETVAVIVGCEVGVLLVDLTSGSAVQVDDHIVLD
jgi:hypothetical protein